jgi:signal transduction histidine kinase
MMVTIIVMIFLLAVYFLYRYFFRQIWSDFFSTIDKINRFDVGSPENLDFPESMIIEFNQLNSNLKLMTERIINDFQGLKDFTGNLSHEIQTPLAVIKSKSELLLQQENQTEQQLQLTSEIHSETIRLSKLIKALTLLTKIGNKQFTNKEKISLKKLITTQLEAFEEIIEMKGIKIQTSFVSEPEIKMNEELAKTLIINLIKNAIRHNINNGKINIELTKNKLIIKNSGKELAIEPQQLFNRFSKANKQTESLGIGLSIVQKICDFYSFKITYSYQAGIHKLALEF